MEQRRSGGEEEEVGRDSNETQDLVNVKFKGSVSCSDWDTTGATSWSSADGFVSQDLSGSSEKKEEERRRRRRGDKKATRKLSVRKLHGNGTRCSAGSSGAESGGRCYHQVLSDLKFF